MDTIPKPQRTFVAVTLMTVIAVTTVFLVYAAILATYTGQTVTIGGTGGKVQYSLDNSAFDDTIPNQNNGTAWYARVYMTAGANQSVTVQWSILKWNSGTLQWDTYWTHPTTTDFYLWTNGTNYIHTTPTGVITNNYNWGLNTTQNGDYRVKAVING